VSSLTGSTLLRHGVDFSPRNVWIGERWASRGGRSALRDTMAAYREISGIH
jgi:hypothetical protein